MSRGKGSSVCDVLREKKGLSVGQVAIGKRRSWDHIEYKMRSKARDEAVKEEVSSKTREGDVGNGWKDMNHRNMIRIVCIHRTIE